MEVILSVVEVNPTDLSTASSRPQMREKYPREADEKSPLIELTLQPPMPENSIVFSRSARYNNGLTLIR